MKAREELVVVREPRPGDMKEEAAVVFVAIVVAEVAFGIIYL